MIAGYTRLSMTKYGDLQGVARQREDLIKLAESLGWTRSGSATKTTTSVPTSTGDRSARSSSVCCNQRAGLVTHVLCNDQDRLVLGMRQLEDVVDAVERGEVSLTSVNGDIDLLTDNGRVVARIRAAVARNEIEKMGRRTRRKKLQHAQNGGPPRGGRRTYDCPLAFEVVPEGAHGPAGATCP